MDDVSISGMLHGKILRNPSHHAKILNMYTSRAKVLPGVNAMLTGEEPPKVKFGNYLERVDWYHLAIGKVRYAIGLKLTDSTITPAKIRSAL